MQVKVGLSFVSYTNAYENLTLENADWNFDAVRDRARNAWNTRLKSVRVGGGPSGWDHALDEQRIVFYTALYHASIHPSTFSDCNGEYLGFDGLVHYTNRTQYHNIPAWDFYQSLVPLLAITAPDVASDLGSVVGQRRPTGSRRRYAALGTCLDRFVRNVRRRQFQDHSNNTNN